MSDNRVLQFNNISKLYSLRQIGSSTLSRDLTRWWKMTVLKQEDPFMKIGERNVHNAKSETDFVWALKDISFSVDEGDVVGIIGRNGSGKSTLLKILSRITTPTTGTINVKGRIASLLEVGTGFHTDLTGRDNVYMNGAILGMSRSEINSKFDDIVEFSGIERYIDTPVKRYSSGMKVKLGFAVAAFLEPEILIVDEVLAVGDAEFQKRAIGKMQSISSESGRTVLFVSHNMNSVLQLCNRGIILDEGGLIFDGTSQEAVKNYIGSLKSQTHFSGSDGDENILRIVEASVTSVGESGSVFFNSSSVNIELVVDVVAKIPSLVIGFNLLSQYDTPLARADYNDVNGLTTLSPGRYRFNFEIPAHTLAPGSYKIRFDVAERRRRCFSTDESSLYFDIIAGSDNFGYVFPDITPKKISIIHENWIRGMESL